MQRGILALLVLAGCGVEEPAKPEGDCPPGASDYDGDGTCDVEDPCPFDAPDDPDGDGECGETDQQDEEEKEEEEEECEYSEFDVPTKGPSPGWFVPYEVQIAVEGIVDAKQWKDFTYDGEGLSARIIFEFLDYQGYPRCIAVFDLSKPGVAVPTQAAWVQAAEGPIVAAWDLDLSGGYTDCDQLDDYYDYPTDDIRSYIAMNSWGIGIGPAHSLHQLAPDVMAQYGESASSLWVEFGKGDPAELGAALSLKHECDVVEHDAAYGTPRYTHPPGPGSVDGAYTSLPVASLYYSTP